MYEGNALINAFREFVLPKSLSNIVLRATSWVILDAMLVYVDPQDGRHGGHVYAMGENCKSF